LRTEKGKQTYEQGKKSIEKEKGEDSSRREGESRTASANGTLTKEESSTTTVIRVGERKIKKKNRDEGEPTFKRQRILRWGKTSRKGRKRAVMRGGLGGKMSISSEGHRGRRKRCSSKRGKSWVTQLSGGEKREGRNPKKTSNAGNI